MYLIHPMPAPLPPEDLALLLKAEPATIGHFQTTGFMRGDIRAHQQDVRIAGPAVTVRMPGNDGGILHHAMACVRPGDVLVIDGAGDLTQALMGEIMASFAQSLGVEGLVIDGAIRDVGALGQRDFPVYARGVTHRGPYKNGPGEINVPVTVGGMVVHPGDIIVGDEDGLLAIAPADAEAVIEGARRQQAKEMAALKSIAEGNFDRSWVAPQRDRMMNT